MSERQQEAMYRLGIDVGSTTVKAAVLDNENNLLYSCYHRHFSDLGGTLKKVFYDLYSVFGNHLVSIAVTGSGGLALSENLDVPFVQEVIAGSKAVREYFPNVTAVIELGGEDAKLTFFEGGLDQRMNGICAGGTGAFIDQMSHLLKTDPSGLDKLAENYKVIYPIAARCGVFAKTDIQSLLNEGACKEDIAASIFQAVVNQTIGGLACGRKIKGKIAFLGGPLFFLAQLRRRFQETLRLKSEDIIMPGNAQVFVAIGAALASNPSGDTDRLHTSETFLSLSEKMSSYHRKNTDISARLSPLFQNEEEYLRFSERHARYKVRRKDPASFEGKCFLGLDIGSTTCKAALIDNDANLLFSCYANNDGSPLEGAVRMLRAVYNELPEGAAIARAAVTGYGENLIKAAFSCDLGEVETVAHFAAAEFFLPGVETILDIGGQDMKYLRVRDGVIENVIINEACSSGCGSFIETFAKSLGLSVQDFAKAGLDADAPVDLGTRCTVFMNSKVRQAQKDGVQIGDISAGLCYSVIKNALFKVIKMRRPSELGDKIIVQGGTFRNDTVLRCFELIAGKDVVRPEIPELMGAFGAALLAKSSWSDGVSSTLISPDALADFTYTSTITRCAQCTNQCLLTVNVFDNGRKLITGNRCERGAGIDKTEDLPNLYAYKYGRLFDYVPLEEEKAPRGTIGIPRVLNMYENYPFWHTFFTELGFRVVLSPPSSRKIYELGIDTISSDTACYPAKLANGHVAALIHQGVRHIFYPCLPKERDEFPNADNHYNCPIVACYAEVISANIDLIREHKVTFYHPFLPYHNRKRLAERLHEELKEFHLSFKEVSRAVSLAWAEDQRFKEDIRNKGEETLKLLRATGRKGIVLSGRPYHLDPEVHHGIPNLITAMGLAVLTEDSVSHLGRAERPLRVLDQWMYHTRLYEAADFVSKVDYLELVQLNSFGCGPDSIAAEQAQEILRRHNKLYSLIKVDDISNLGAVRIRLRSLKSAMTARQERMLNQSASALYRKTARANHAQNHYTIIGPQMSPVHFELIEEAIRSEGYRFVVLSSVDKKDIEEGLRNVNNDSCYPAIIIIGQILNALKSGKYDLSNTAILMSQTGGPCRASNYVALLETALEKNGFDDIPIFSLSISLSNKANRFKLTPSLFKKSVMALVYGDFFLKALYQVRPYERRPGISDRLYGYWLDICKQNIREGSRSAFRENLIKMAQVFDRIEVYDTPKLKVGLVGEIMVKYHPAANNDMVSFLEQSGAEMVVPGLSDFFLYCALFREFNHQYLDGSNLQRILGNFFIRYVESYRDDMRRALRLTKKFKVPATVFELADKVRPFLSLCNHTGEGWLLTAEIIDLIENDVHSIVCMQPFACLPNHISGRGMIKILKEKYPQVNITAIDYDPGASNVNQVNRIRLLLESGKANYAQ